ncbi:MAG TPA: rubrerythrin family protein [Candidatus Melainabacteria bacterium]|nr:rubrerythrin family protein [Candidatus Melainabacteria bacterium]
MNNLTNTETEKNLEAAFAGESMANRKYLYFAKLARELGNEEVAELFEETANQETGHAFAHLQLLYPSKEMTVEKLLELAIEGELYETNQMYPEFERIARQEGRLDAVEEFIEQADESREHAKVFTQAAKRFNSLGKVEEWHARRYQKALENLGEQSAESEQGEQKKSA